MANWKNSITVEIRRPYDTQGFTIDFTTAVFCIDWSDIWFSGYDRDSRVWKAVAHWGDCSILVIGKTVNTPKHGDKPTTYKVTAWDTIDGMRPTGRKFKIKVLSYN